MYAFFPFHSREQDLEIPYVFFQLLIKTLCSCLWGIFLDSQMVLLSPAHSETPLASPSHHSTALSTNHADVLGVPS